MGNPGQTNYSASKGGLNAMTKSFAKEAASRGIRYNAVTPGFIQTDMTHELKAEVKAEYEKIFLFQDSGTQVKSLMQ